MSIRGARRRYAFGRRRAFGLASAVSLALALGLSCVSCTNNLSRGPAGSNLLLLNGSAILNLTNVLRDNSNPSTVLDLIGDGSGAMGTLCGTSAATSTGTTTGSSTATTASACSCTYSYTSPSVGTQQIDVPTIYQENNLIECGFTQIPADVSTVNVQVHVISVNAYSTTFPFNLMSGAGANPTLASNFSVVQRIQCRDIISLPYPFGPSLGSTNDLIDPIQSEDPSLIYPLNYYGTNLGFNYGQFILSQQTSWYCPPNPADPSFKPNFTIYSVGPDSAGSQQIYPPTGSAFDRSTFYLSKAAAGVFTVPFNSYIAPNLTASGQNTPLGYAAAPVSTGANQESCPAVNIPSGYHWVKVWLFRADLPDRRYSVSPGLQSVGEVACNPGKYPGTATQVFPNCAATGPGAAETGFLDNPGAPLVDRVFYGEGNPAANQYLCGELTGTGGVGTSVSKGYSLLSSGTDVYQNPATATVSWSAPPPSVDPMDISNLVWGAGNGALKDFGLTTVDLDQGHPRYDFVFVVTPQTVMAADMANSSNSVDYPYIPYRFPNAADCLSSNPNAPTSPTDCLPSKIIHYGLKLHDVSTNGDPPANDPSRPGIFPMCALQPN